MKKSTLTNLILLFVICHAVIAQKKDQKNLLFIITDQQQYKAMSLAGNTVLETPNLDRLARDGAFFRNAYSASAVCAPARASILTGHTVENTGVLTNEQAYYYDKEPVMTMLTFDEVLTENGYHCEYYGKWHTLTSHAEVYQNPKLESQNGKSVFAHGGQRAVYMDYINKKFPKRPLKEGELYDTFTDRPYKPDPIDVGYGFTSEELEERDIRRTQPNLHGKLMVPPEHSFTAFQAKETIEAIERLKDKTFSITCSFHFPHAPMIPPEPYYSMYPPEEMTPPASIADNMANSPYRGANGRLGMPEYADPNQIRYMISNYYGLIREIDVWVGKILAKIEELGLADKTMIVFTSDHGEMLGAHGMREKNVFYEESSHIPLAIKLSGEINKNTVVDGYVSHIDLFATILDYLQVDQPESDGKSLRGLIEGTDSSDGSYVVTEWLWHGPRTPNYMIVKDGWKLMIPYTEDSKVINAMYNLEQDPHEMNNLLGKNPNRYMYQEKAEELRKDLLEWLKHTGSTNREGVRQRKLM